MRVFKIPGIFVILYIEEGEHSYHCPEGRVFLSANYMNRNHRAYFKKKWLTDHGWSRHGSLYTKDWYNLYGDIDSAYYLNWYKGNGYWQVEIPAWAVERVDGNPVLELLGGDSFTAGQVENAVEKCRVLLILDRLGGV